MAVEVLGTPEILTAAGSFTAQVSYTPEEGTARAILFEIMWNVDSAAQLTNVTYGGDEGGGARSVDFVTTLISWTPQVGYAVGVLLLDGTEDGTNLDMTFATALGCNVTVRAWTFGGVASVGEFGTGGASNTDNPLSVLLDEDYSMTGSGLVFTGCCSFTPDNLADPVTSIEMEDAPADSEYVAIQQHHHSDQTLDARAATFPANIGSFQTGWLIGHDISGEDEFFGELVTVSLLGPEDTAGEFNCDCEEVSPYKTLAQLRVDFMIGIGMATQAAAPPPGFAAAAAFYLNQAQNFLIDTYKQVTLERFFRWTMVPNQRYYGIADGSDACSDVLDPLKVTWVGFEDLNRTWVELIEGIPPQFYTRVQTAPGWPSRYEIRQCIEVFPAPQAAYTLWVKANNSKAPFAAEDSHPTMDESAVLFMAVGMYREDTNKPGAARWKSMALDRIKTIVAGQHNTARYVPNPGGPLPPMTPPIYLPLHGQPS